MFRTLRLGLLWQVVVLLGVCSGCQGTSATSSDLGTGQDGAADLSAASNPPDLAVAPVVTESQACTLHAQAVCGQLSKCSPFFGFMVPYQDLATCVARNQLACAGLTSLAGATVKPADLAACASAVANQSCDAFLTGSSPAACRSLGTAKDGDPCGSGSQCASGTCSGGALACGVCVARAAEGAPCPGQTRCDYGLYCSGTGGGARCAQYGALGNSCNVAVNLLCLPSLTCQAGQCSTPLPAGAACNGVRDPQYGGCDGLHGLTCPAGANPTCTAAPTATATQACPAGTTCIRGSNCIASSCVVQAADNAACNVASGPLCMSYATCTAGKCTVFDASACK